VDSVATVLFEARGMYGELRAVYQPAAWLGFWSLRAEQEAMSSLTCEVIADVRDRDAYWVTAPPFALYLEIGGHIWSWPLVKSFWHEDTVRILAPGRPLVEKGTVST
jgi:hypothetical protein